MPLTDVIEAELLATLEGDGEPQSVLDKFSASKGPLYAAIARATAKATTRFAEVCSKVRDTRAHLRDAEAQATDAEKRAREAERRAKAAEKRLAEVTQARERDRPLLDAAEALRADGFDDAALGRLRSALLAVAQAEGTRPADAVGRFLDAAADAEHLAAARRQAAEATAQALKAEKDARHRESAAKVRNVAVDWAEWLVRERVPVKAVRSWQVVAVKLGLTADTLPAGLAQALEQHGTLEAVRHQWQEAVADLRAEHGRLQAEVGALHTRRDHLTAAIAAVSDEGIARVRATADSARAEVEDAAARFRAVALDAARLEKEVAFARAVVSRDEGTWAAVAPETWIGVLRCLEVWSAANLANPEVPMPDPVRKVARGITEYLAAYGPARVPLRGLVLVQGVMRAEPLRSALRALASASRP
jgi:chromosome segregation ATPase